jgi:hypothetical protein
MLPRFYACFWSLVVGSDLGLCRNFVYFLLLDYFCENLMCMMMYLEILRCCFYVVFLYESATTFYDYENELCMILDY